MWLRDGVDGGLGLLRSSCTSLVTAKDQGEAVVGVVGVCGVTIPGNYLASDSRVSRSQRGGVVGCFHCDLLL